MLIMEMRLKVRRGKRKVATMADEETKESTNSFSFGKKKVPHVTKKDFANFHLIYTSRDDEISVFEDPDGHLCAVRTSRLV